MGPELGPNRVYHFRQDITLDSITLDRFYCSCSIWTCVGHFECHLQEEHVTLCDSLTTTLRELGCISWFTKDEVFNKFHLFGKRLKPMLFGLVLTL
jgi:hypothetical protein